MIRSNRKIRQSLAENPRDLCLSIPIGSMVLLYMVTWIPSIYPSHVCIYTIHYGSVMGLEHRNMMNKYGKTLRFFGGGSFFRVWLPEPKLGGKLPTTFKGTPPGSTHLSCKDTSWSMMIGGLLWFTTFFLGYILRLLWFLLWFTMVYYMFLLSFIYWRLSKHDDIFWDTPLKTNQYCFSEPEFCHIVTLGGLGPQEDARCARFRENSCIAGREKQMAGGSLSGPGKYVYILYIHINYNLGIRHNYNK